MGTALPADWMRPSRSKERTRPESPGQTSLLTGRGSGIAVQQPTCKQQFTATSGTIFHDSHLQRTKWFLALALTSESKKGISANQVHCALGIGYKAAGISAIASGKQWRMNRAL